MVKRKISSRPIFSPRTLLPILATLCLASVMLIGTVPAYADGAQITVTIDKVANFKCAQVLFGKSKQAGTSRLGNAATKDGDQIQGTVVGAGMFSINFYNTADCSGKRVLFQRFATTTDANYNCDVTQSTVQTGQSEDACQQDS